MKLQGQGEGEGNKTIQQFKQRYYFDGMKRSNNSTEMFLNISGNNWYRQNKNYLLPSSYKQKDHLF